MIKTALRLLRVLFVVSLQIVAGSVAVGLWRLADHYPRGPWGMTLVSSVVAIVIAELWVTLSFFDVETKSRPIVQPKPQQRGRAS